MQVLSKLSPLLVLIALLAGCGPERNEFAPPCPRPSFVRGLEDVTRFAKADSNDLTDMVIQGRLVRLDGDCKLIDKKGAKVEARVSVGAQFLRGPAMRGRQDMIPVFIAVMENGVILDKQVLQFSVEFPSNVSGVGMTSQEIVLDLPTTATKSPAAFDIVAGFQLSPTELELNRHRTGR